MQFAQGASGGFDDQMIAGQTVDELKERPVAALLHTLAAVVSEAEMHSLATRRAGPQHDVDDFGSEIAVFRMAGQPRFVHLKCRGLELRDLPGQDSGEGRGPGRKFAVMLVSHHGGQHVGAGEGDFEGTQGEGFLFNPIADQHEPPRPDGGRHNPCGPIAVSSTGRLCKIFPLGFGEIAIQPVHLVDETLYHAARRLPQGIPAIHLAITNQFYAGDFLGADGHRGCIAQRLGTARGAQPIGCWVAADNCGDHGSVGNAKS